MAFILSHLQEKDNLGNVLESNVYPIPFKDSGVYRIGVPINNDETSKGSYKVIGAESCNLSEAKEFEVDSDCANQEIYLTWLNSTGGWDYWKFTAEKDYNLNIEDKPSNGVAQAQSIQVKRQKHVVISILPTQVLFNIVVLIYSRLFPVNKRYSRIVNNHMLLLNF